MSTSFPQHAPSLALLLFVSSFSFLYFFFVCLFLKRVFKYLCRWEAFFLTLQSSLKWVYTSCMFCISSEADSSFVRQFRTPVQLWLLHGLQPQFIPDYIKSLGSATLRPQPAYFQDLVKNSDKVSFLSQAKSRVSSWEIFKSYGISSNWTSWTNA